MTATLLEHVRVRAEGVDPVTARLRLAHLLADADLRPPGLPPAALLLVRRLTDPRPRTLALETGGMRPPPTWERAFVAALERCLRGAARPAHGPVPAGAEAVLFADRAELLACLARDACDGTAWTRWWWRRVLAPVRMSRDPVVEVWRAAPEHAPAALGLLAARGDAVRFARSVPEDAARALIAAVATAFAAPRPHEAIVAPLPRAARRASAAPSPVWRAIAPEAAAPDLAPAQRVLLGVLLALRRAPATARGAEFAAGVERERARPHGAIAVPDPPAAAPRAPSPPRERRPRAWPAAPTAEAGRAWAATRGESSGALPPSPPGSAHARPGHEPARRAVRPADPPAASPAPVPPGTQAEREAVTPHDAPLPAPPRAEPTNTPPPAPPTGAALPAERARPALAAPSPASPPEVAPSPHARPATHADVRPAPPAPPTPEAPAQIVDTGLGGVFYLLNLALCLGLYGDFTQPRASGLGLDPWDFLTLLGAWLARDDPRREDPLWPLLAELAGRTPGEPPGRGFRPPRAWRVPPAWLEPVGSEGHWRWSAAGELLRIAHPAGFLAAAVPRTRVPAAEQLHRELRRLAVPGSAPRRRPAAPGAEPPAVPAVIRASLAREPCAPPARWVGRLGAYAEVRLARALGLAERRAVAAELLHHRARVFVSPSHVDVELPLAELPLAIRFAGLDRTPGWIPAAGHFVAFHFR